MTDAQTPHGRRCPEGHAVPDESRFCPECGTAMAKQDDSSSQPESQPRRVARPFLVLAGAALVLVVLGVVLVAGRSDDQGSDETPSRQAVGPQATSTAPSLEQQCQPEMSVALTKLVGDIAAGYGNFDGPGATEVAADYGMASAFFQAAAQVTGEAYSAYLERGTQGAADAIPGIAAKACSTLVESEAPGATEEPLNGLPQPSPGDPAPGCTTGASGCMFYNGIQTEALFADIAGEFAVPAADVGCDLSDVRYDNVAVDDTFYCSTDSSGYPTVAVLVTDSAPFYSISAAPNSGD